MTKAPDTGPRKDIPLAGEAKARGGIGLLLARPDLWLLATVVILGFAIRVYHLDNLPDTLVGDEADNAQGAIRILHGQPVANGFFGFDWTQQPAFSTYLQSAFIKLFGVNITAVRLSSAVLTTLALIPFYFLLRRYLSATSALLTTFLLATNLWYLNFSRSAWNNAHICFYLLMAMLFLVLGLNAVRTTPAHPWWTWFCFGATGFFCALGLYGYPSGRAILLSIIAFFPVALFFCRHHWKRLLLGYAVIGFVAVAVFLPQAVYISKNWEGFNGRTNTVLLTHSAQFNSNPLETLWAQVQKNVRGPWDGSVNNTPRYTPVGEPQLDTVTGALVAAGMVLSFLLPGVRRQPENWLWWIMLLVAWSITQLITVGTPNGARGVIYVPTLLYFAGVAIEGVVLFGRWLPGHQRWLAIRLLPAAGVAAVILVAGYVNVNHYAAWQSNQRTRQARWPYLEAQEFAAWAQWVIDVADNKQRETNLGQWHAIHPVRDPSVPAPTSPRP